MNSKYTDIERNLSFHELDTVVLKVKYVRYACGECHPDYFFVEELIYSELEDSAKHLGREILASFSSTEDEYVALNSIGEENAFIFYRQMKTNNYNMLKIKVPNQKKGKIYNIISTPKI